MSGDNHGNDEQKNKGEQPETPAPSESDMSGTTLPYNASNKSFSAAPSSADDHINRLFDSYRDSTGSERGPIAREIFRELHSRHNDELHQTASEDRRADTSHVRRRSRGMNEDVMRGDARGGYGQRTALNHLRGEATRDDERHLEREAYGGRGDRARGYDRDYHDERERYLSRGDYDRYSSGQYDYSPSGNRDHKRGGARGDERQYDDERESFRRERYGRARYDNDDAEEGYSSYRHALDHGGRPRKSADQAPREDWENSASHSRQDRPSLGRPRDPYARGSGREDGFDAEGRYSRPASYRPLEDEVHDPQWREEEMRRHSQDWRRAENDLRNGRHTHTGRGQSDGTNERRINEDDDRY